MRTRPYYVSQNKFIEDTITVTQYLPETAPEMQ